MAMNARTESALAEISTLKPEQFASADVNKLLANYNEISDALISKLSKWFKLGFSTALQQRKFIELDETAVQSIGAYLAPATQNWLLESEDYPEEVEKMLESINKLARVSPALRNYAREHVEDLGEIAQKRVLKFFGVRTIEDLPAARGTRTREEPHARRSPRVRKEGTAGTRAIRSVKAPMDASEDNLAIIQIYGAATSRDAHNAAKEVDVNSLENASVKRFVKAVAASRKGAEIESLKEKFAKRHADLLENTGSADASQDQDAGAKRPRAKTGFAATVESVLGTATREEKHRSHPRESDRLLPGNKNTLVRRGSAAPAKVKDAIRSVRRPA